MRSGDEVSPSSPLLPPALLGGLVLLAALPRLVGALDSLWLDEIWSLELAHRADTAWQVVTGLHHDNNHYLNTLWLRALGQDAGWLWYRLPALVGGVGTVALVGRMEWRAGRLEGVLAALLFAVSYPFVHYATEARGYGLVVLLSLAAFTLLERQHRRGDRPTAMAFGIVASLGFLAHLTFLTVYVPLLAWSAWVMVARLGPARRTVRLATAHLPPLAVLTFLVLVDVRHLVRGGGPELPPLQGWLRSWGYTLGVPADGVLAAVFGAALLGVVLVGLRDRSRGDRGEWVFLVLVLTFPVGLLVSLGAGYAPPRYFLASLAFGLLLTARGLAVLLRGGALARATAGVLLAAVVFGNGWNVKQFLEQGRGDYHEVVRYVARHTPGDTIRSPFSLLR